MSLDVLNWILLGLCLGASFLLSGMEAGVFALNRVRVRRLARSGKRSAQLLNGFLEKPEKFLWTILVGNTIANFLILGWLLAKLHEWFLGQKAVILVSFALVVFLFYTFFDLLPKMLFRAHPNSLCLSAARVFRIINFLLSPLVLLVEDASKTLLRWTGGRAFTGRSFGNREELRAVMQESSQALTSDEHAMVNRILDLQHFTVGQIARPLSEVVSVAAEMPLREVLKLAREKNVSRLPVWEMRGGQKRLGGLIEIGPLLYRDAVDLDKPVATAMTPAVFVNENVRLEIALKLLQRAGQRMGIVLSRDRNEIGIVTFKDIFKVMFGEVKL